MKKKFRKYLISNWVKVFSVFFFVLLLGAYVSTFAVFSGSPYAPGATLDPECAPGSENCKVDISSSTNPWLTGTSNIYHNGNVNVGSDTADISSSIGGGSSFTSKTMGSLNSNSLDMIPTIVLNNDGNPVIVYYSTQENQATYNFLPSAEASGANSSLNIIVCSDATCTHSTPNVIDSGFYANSNFKPSVKIDSHNIAHVAYMDGNRNIKYAVCDDDTCSSVSTPEIIVSGGNG